MADVIQTVSTSEAIQSAKPLPKNDSVNQGSIWTALASGSALLFGTTVAAENNESWFPAIAKANKAMKINRKQEQVDEAEPPMVLDIEAEVPPSSSAAVLAGLEEAKSRVLQNSPQPAVSAASSSSADPPPAHGSEDAPTSGGGSSSSSSTVVEDGATPDQPAPQSGSSSAEPATAEAPADPLSSSERLQAFADGALAEAQGALKQLKEQQAQRQASAAGTGKE